MLNKSQNKAYSATNNLSNISFIRYIWHERIDGKYGCCSGQNGTLLAQTNVKPMLGRIGLLFRKSVWVTIKLAVWTWLVSFPLLIPAAIAAAIFKYTSVPWIGGNLFLAVFFVTALALAIKIKWPVWPTDEDMKDLKKFGNSSSSTQSTGGVRSSSEQEQVKSAGQSGTDVYPWASGGKSPSEMTEGEKDWFWADEEGYFEGDDKFDDDM